MLRRGADQGWDSTCWTAPWTTDPRKLTQSDTVKQKEQKRRNNKEDTKLNKQEEKMKPILTTIKKKTLNFPTRYSPQSNH